MTAMNVTKVVAFSILSFAIPVAAQPVVGAAVNAASYSHQGLPNSGIAQGSLFVLFGTGMGPASIEHISAFPLLPTLGGTSVSVTAGGQTVAAYMIYTLATQVAAILPSNTPIGSGTVTVTYNGQTSAPAPIQVVANSFGIFAVNQAGYGTGVFTDAYYQAASFTASAEPGETWTIWGTGLGAVSGDEAGGPLPGDMKSLAVQVYVGNQQANVVYRGRSGCCSGVDQIAFQIPSGVQGCSVPVAIQVGNILSNFVTLPIASGTRACSNPSIFTADEIAKYSAQGTISVGSVGLDRTTNTTYLNNDPRAPWTVDNGGATFQKFQFQQFISSDNGINLPLYGACSVYTFAGFNMSRPPPVEAVPLLQLNAGASIAVSGPDGIQQMGLRASQIGLYDGFFGGGFPAPPAAVAPLYLSPGAYTIGNGPGGPDVGAFSINLVVPEPFVWTNQNSLYVIPRGQDLLITWAGADSDDIDISGVSTVGESTSSPYSAGFDCRAKGSDHQFIVPFRILLSLPPGPDWNSGLLGILSTTQLQSFSAPGIDKGVATYSLLISQAVQFQ